MDRPSRTIGADEQANPRTGPGHEGLQDAVVEIKSGTVRERKPIPADWAFRLCEMICQENLETRFSLAKLICRRCQNDPTRMGFARRPDNRACFLVNAREAHYRRAFNRSLS